MMALNTPLTEDSIDQLKVGDVVTITGDIYTGRDAVLPKIVKAAEEGTLVDLGIDLQGAVIFHTAVSPAGVGPTSSNKVEIESTFEPLSKAEVFNNPEIDHGVVTWNEGQIDCAPEYMYEHSYEYALV